MSAFSWNSELPSGHNPFWIRDEGLSALGLHPGDAVSVDTRVEPKSGDLVVAEAEVDGDSVRLARRYLVDDGNVRLESADGADVLELSEDQVMVMGVIVGRLSLSGEQATESPL